MDDLGEIEAIAGALLRRVSPAERRSLLRKIVRGLARSQSTRIAAQRDPDGGAFPRRKPKAEPSRGRYALCFLYPKGSKDPRRVIMKSWVRQGPLLTGFDIEAGGIRSFFWDHVAKWLPVPEEHRNATAGKFRRRGALRRDAMFRRLGKGRYLRSDATDREAWVGFAGRASEIAWVHQEGRRDRPAKGAKEVRYARRRILGLTDADRQAVLEQLFAGITE